MTVTCSGLPPGPSWTTSNGTVDTGEFSVVNILCMCKTIQAMIIIFVFPTQKCQNPI